MKLSVLLVLAVLMLAISGCGEAVMTPEEASAAMETLELQLSEAQAARLADYEVVRKDFADKAELAAFSKIRSALNAVCGREFSPVTDWVNRGEEVPNDRPEILIGETNRDISAVLHEEITSYRENCQRDFGIRIQNGQIAITGATGDALSSAVDWFIVNLLAADEALPEDYEYIYRHDYDVIELYGTAAAEYTFRFEGNLHPFVFEEADKLSAYVYDTTGFSMSDSEEPAGHEIVVSITLDNPADYSIRHEDGKLYVEGGCYLSLIHAMKQLNELILEADTTLSGSASYTGTYETDVPLELDGGYKLVWNDEFDGETVSEYNWMGTDTNYTGHDGGIVYRRVNERTVRVENGNMVLSGFKSDTGPNDYEIPPHIKTQNHMTFMYGYLEMYAKLPTGKGVWPALWLNSGGLGYDIAPEIDVFEIFGSHTTLRCNVHKWPNSVMKAEGREHTSLDGVVSANARSYVLKNGKYSDDYHTYAFEWDEDYMIFLFDGKEYYRHPMDDELRKELYVIVSFVLGGAEVAPPDETTVLPAEYWVDWIRLYQKEGQTITFWDNK